MRLPNLLIVNFLILFLPVWVHAQCSSKISITEKGLDAQGAGFIQVHVKSEQPYEVTLVAQGARPTDDVSLENTKFSGNHDFLFDKLQADKKYAVVVTFKHEERPICRRKRTDYIEFNKR